MSDRDSRTELLIGRGGLELLKDANVTVAGAGAVGGYAIEALVRAGVGRIRVIDGDAVSESNINRQVLATYGTVGRRKVDVAKERALSISPGIEFTGVDALLTPENVAECIGPRPDILVDAIDTVANKIALLRYAAANGITTFSSMGAALHLETSMVRVAPLMKTKVCPLAASVRSGLRDCDTSSIVCVYSEEPPVSVPRDRDDSGKSVLGSLPTVPAVFGMILANEAIKEILSRGPRC